eukprot:35272-Pyramimonas_sp.AAC.1
MLPIPVRVQIDILVAIFEHALELLSVCIDVVSAEPSLPRSLRGLLRLCEVPVLREHVRAEAQLARVAVIISTGLDGAWQHVR